VRDVHVKLPELIQEAKAFIAANAPYYGGVRVRCVTQEKEGRRQCAVWILQAFPKGAAPAPVKSIKYREIHLLEGWMKPEEVVPLLENSKEKGITVDGETATCDLIEQQPCWAILASANDHSIRPGRRYLLRAGSNLSVGSPVLLEYGLPFHDSIYEAIGAWVEVPKANEVDSGFIGTGLMFLPECRARMSGVQRDGNLITVSVEKSKAELIDLRIQGAFGVFNPRLHWSIGVEVKEGVATLEVSECAEFFECYLIGRDQAVYDYLREGPTWHEGLGPVLRTGPESSGAETIGPSIVEAAIVSGENEQVEYKEFVNPKDSERVEAVARAVMAFLNTEGGRVFIGIDNKCQVAGVDDGLRAAGYLAGEGSTDALDRYLGFLRQQIAERVVPSVTIEFDVVECRGRRVIVLTVPPGEDRPYHRQEQNIVYIRKGSSNRPADPRTELPSFYEKKPERSPWLPS
jgi:hypothetical protein